MNKHEARKDKVVEIKEVLRLAVVYGVDAEWLGDLIIIRGEHKTITFKVIDDATCKLA
jgi:hypothetical protein